MADDVIEPVGVRLADRLRAERAAVGRRIMGGVRLQLVATKSRSADQTACARTC